ncbi:MAG: hypothetical protein IKZ09_09060 [Clostridia bacterium]|nr:hypothetical protein [Clostridia bacterium]
MLQLYPVFSDHALFQCESTLTLRGIADPKSALTAEILAGETVIESGSAAAAKDGTFALTLNTPKGSFDVYEIRVQNGEECVTLSDIQFGELWIASGQSNMEMGNIHQPEFYRMAEAIVGTGIRTYSMAYQKDGADPNEFSVTPEDDTPGKWLLADGNYDWSHVSACATAFVLDIARKFKEMNKEIPVGFLNVSWGGTPIFGWIPLDVMDADERCHAFMEQQGRYPFSEKWNTYGGGNFQQPAAMYNRKIAPTRGLKARGIIWYQGENEVGIEWSQRIYAHALRVYHKYYTEEFAADPAAFPMISSLIYPWVYADNGSCMRAYVNQAFIETAKESPEKFIFCPIDDLPPVWAANLGNHPIHPAHKYRLGSRMARLALINTYGDNGQRAAATLDSYTVDGSRLLLKFADVGCGLYVKDGHIDGLYIAGENGHYLPAECEVISKDTLAVWHPYLDHPVHAAYDISSFACGANLWAGEYPAAPFATDFANKELLRLESMPFLNPDLVSVWETRMNPSQQPLEVYYFPIWKPMCESEVCQDNAFVNITEGYTHSIRISGNRNPIGAYVSATEFHKLNLQKFTALELDLYHRGSVNGYLEIDYAIENGVKKSVQRPISAIDGAPYTFKRYSADLTALPEGRIESLRFVFNVEDDQPLYYVNITKLVLKP